MEEEIEGERPAQSFYTSVRNKLKRAGLTKDKIDALMVNVNFKIINDRYMPFLGNKMLLTYDYLKNYNIGHVDRPSYTPYVTALINAYNQSKVPSTSTEKMDIEGMMEGDKPSTSKDPHKTIQEILERIIPRSKKDAETGIIIDPETNVGATVRNYLSGKDVISEIKALDLNNGISDSGRVRLKIAAEALTTEPEDPRHIGLPQFREIVKNIAAERLGRYGVPISSRALGRNDFLKLEQELGHKIKIRKRRYK